MSRAIFSRLGRRAALVLAAVALSATAATAAGTTIYDRVARGARNVHSLWLGAYDNYLIVQGDGDTDLDCWLYDADGRLVSSDTGATDLCVLPAPTVGAHRLEIRNLGRVSNYYAIWAEN
jgi:hypothetical protein